MPTTRKCFAIARREQPEKANYCTRPLLAGIGNPYSDPHCLVPYARFFIAITCLARLAVSRFMTESGNSSISVKNASHSANVSPNIPGWSINPAPNQAKAAGVYNLLLTGEVTADFGVIGRRSEPVQRGIPQSGDLVGERRRHTDLVG